MGTSTTLIKDVSLRQKLLVFFLHLLYILISFCGLFEISSFHKCHRWDRGEREGGKTLCKEVEKRDARVSSTRRHPQARYSFTRNKHKHRNSVISWKTTTLWLLRRLLFALKTKWLEPESGNMNGKGWKSESTKKIPVLGTFFRWWREAILIDAAVDDAASNAVMFGRCEISSHKC